MITIASTIILLWVSYESSTTHAILTKPDARPSRSTLVENLDRDGKTGKVPTAGFEDRWNAGAWNAGAAIKPPTPPRRDDKVLDGCESAFSVLVRIGNFSTRCVADADAAGESMRLG